MDGPGTRPRTCSARPATHFFAASSLGEVYRLRADSLAELSETFRTGIARVGRLVDSMLVEGAGYRAIQPILGVGPLLAATFVAEIGDISRFTSAVQVCCKAHWRAKRTRHLEVKVASSEAVSSFADQ